MSNEHEDVNLYDFLNSKTILHTNLSMEYYSAFRKHYSPKENNYEPKYDIVTYNAEYLLNIQYKCKSTDDLHLVYMLNDYIHSDIVDNFEIICNDSDAIKEIKYEIGDNFYSKDELNEYVALTSVYHPLFIHVKLNNYTNHPIRLKLRYYFMETKDRRIIASNRIITNNITYEYGQAFCNKSINSE